MTSKTLTLLRERFKVNPIVMSSDQPDDDPSGNSKDNVPRPEPEPEDSDVEELPEEPDPVDIEAERLVSEALAAGRYPEPPEAVSSPIGGLDISQLYSNEVLFGHDPTPGIVAVDFTDPKSLFDPSWYFRKVLRSPGSAAGLSLCGIRKLANSLRIPFMMFDKAEMLCRRKRNYPCPWNAVADAFAGLWLRRRVPISSDHQRRDGDRVESFCRIVAHHAQHPSRQHRGRRLRLKSCGKVNLLPSFCSAE
jgi:hypothetical protein